VRAHPSPKGRTPYTHGRHHGATFYLDGTWSVLRHTQPTFELKRVNFSFSGGFNEALISTGHSAVISMTAVCPLSLFFGASERHED